MAFFTFSLNIQGSIPPQPSIQTEKQGQDKKADPKPVIQPALPIYSYKDYPPAPTMIYTSHEEEANDLVQTLRGCGRPLLYGGHVLLILILQANWIRYGMARPVLSEGTRMPDCARSGVRQEHDPLDSC